MPIQPLYNSGTTTLYCGDCRDIIPGISGISAIITDPPYEISFMEKSWDKSKIAYDPKVWEGCLNALMPGAHLLSFGGTRTYHRMACAIEDAGFEIRDMIEWVYGQGMPKSMNISKAIDKNAGAEGRTDVRDPSHKDITSLSTLDAQKWNGWGTSLKPAHESICLARKPLSEKTIMENVLKFGTGGINIDDCRVHYSPNDDALNKGVDRAAAPRADFRGGNFHTGTDWSKKKQVTATGMTSKGRFPANLIHDGSEEAELIFPETSKSLGGKSGHTAAYSGGYKEEYYGDIKPGYGDEGTASRYFYCAKASPEERGENNDHPTIKPLALMRYLIKLITPPGGIVLDPFCGSGSTLIAARQLGFKTIGIDINERYCEIAIDRLNKPVLYQEKMF